MGLINDIGLGDLLEDRNNHFNTPQRLKYARDEATAIDKKPIGPMNSPTQMAAYMLEQLAGKRLGNIGNQGQQMDPNGVQPTMPSSPGLLSKIFGGSQPTPTNPVPTNVQQGSGNPMLSALLPSSNPGQFFNSQYSG